LNDIVDGVIHYFQNKKSAENETSVASDASRSVGQMAAGPPAI
jgi:hypothetical protein